MSTKLRTRLARMLQIVLLVLASSGLLAQLYLAVPLWGLLNAGAERRTAATAALRFADYFTVQSNLLAIAATATGLVLGLRRHKVPTRWWPVVQLDMLAGLGVTAVIYQALLRTSDEATGAAGVAVVLHVLVPLLAFSIWWLLPPVHASHRDVAAAAAWPVAYVAVTLIVAAATDWAPYPFLDVRRHGWGLVSLAVLAVLVLFLLIASMCRLLDARRPTVGTALRSTPERSASLSP